MLLEVGDLGGGLALLGERGGEADPAVALAHARAPGPARARFALVALLTRPPARAGRAQVSARGGRVVHVLAQEGVDRAASARGRGRRPGWLPLDVGADLDQLADVAVRGQQPAQRGRRRRAARAW